MSHEVRSYDYVNHPYAAVRAALLADPAGVLRRATHVGEREAAKAIAALHVKLGGLDIAAEVALTVRVARDTIAYGRRATELVVEWQHADRPGLFPAMTAKLVVYPLTSTETQLELDGTYEPPLGLLGAAIDSVVGHRLARAAINGFIEEVAVYLRQGQVAIPAMAAAAP